MFPKGKAIDVWWCSYGEMRVGTEEKSSNTNGRCAGCFGKSCGYSVGKRLLEWLNLDHPAKELHELWKFHDLNILKVFRNSSNFRWGIVTFKVSKTLRMGISYPPLLEWITKKNCILSNLRVRPSNFFFLIKIVLFTTDEQVRILVLVRDANWSSPCPKSNKLCKWDAQQWSAACFFSFSYP